jgi:N-acetylglucosamine-6-phosphate deacetylase
MYNGSPSDTIVRFKNYIQGLDGAEETKDLYISTTTGRIVQKPLQDANIVVQDLGGRILSPGLIEVQLNGAMGFNFSEIPDSDAELESYVKSYQDTCRGLIRTGVTSFLPTLTTAASHSFKRVRRDVPVSSHDITNHDTHLDVK